MCVLTQNALLSLVFEQVYTKVISGCRRQKAAMKTLTEPFSVLCSAPLLLKPLWLQQWLQVKLT